MIKTILLILTILIFCSCATLLNSRTDSINIVTSEPTKIKVLNDTLNKTSESNFIAVERSKKLLEVSVFTDQISKTVNIKSGISIVFWLNLYAPIGLIGFLIDLNNPNRFNYPNTVYIDLNKKENNYLTFKPLDSSYSKYKDVLHTDRLKPEDEMEIPRHPNVYYSSNKEGKYWTISLPLNIRIGWIF